MTLNVFALFDYLREMRDGLRDLRELRFLPAKIDALLEASGVIIDTQQHILDTLDVMQGDLAKILRFFAPGEAVSMELVVLSSTGEATIRNGDSMQLPRNSSVTFRLKVYDSLDPLTRNEAVLDGKPTINCTNPAVVMTIDDDGLGATLKSAGAAGIGLLTVEGDAKIGDGVTPILFTADVNVPPGEAVSGEIVFSTPVPNDAVPVDPGQPPV